MTAELLARIHEHPDDRSARQVYADALVEAGDPRGEFIALRLSGKDPKRAAKLFARHKKAWVGRLERYLFVARELEFQDGFLSACELRPMPKSVADATGWPEWSTLALPLHEGRLVETAQAQLARPVHRPVMRSLRDAGTLGAWDALLPLARLKRPLPLETIVAYAFSAGEPAWRDELGALWEGAFPSLRRLELHARDVESIDWVLGSPIPRRLTRLDVVDSLGRPSDAIRRWLGRELSYAISVGTGGPSWRFTLLGRRVEIDRVNVGHALAEESRDQELAIALAQMPADLELVVREPPADDLRAVLPARARFER